jgi:transcriptional regulator with XRE-family HTH domain
MCDGVPESKASTVPWPDPKSGLELFGTIAFIGTLGLITGGALRERAGTANLPFQVNETRPAGFWAARQETVLNTPAENLAQVRKVLHPSITELANLLGVSRQAVYDWLAGKGISSQHEDKVESLAKAASVISASGLNVFQPLHRRLPGGKTLFETIRDGGSPESVALDLVRIARRDVEQRQQLDARLSGRRAAINFDEIGLPNLSEES